MSERPVIPDWNTQMKWKGQDQKKSKGKWTSRVGSREAALAPSWSPLSLSSLLAVQAVPLGPR